MPSPRERSFYSSPSSSSYSSASKAALSEIFADSDETTTVDEDIPSPIIDSFESKTDEVKAKHDELERMTKYFEADARASAKEVMDKLKKLTEAAKRLIEMIRNGRVTSAQSREKTMSTLGKLYDLIETDSEQVIELRNLLEEIDALAAPIEQLHSNFYRHENFHDAKDVANRVKEMRQQTTALEKTLRDRGNPEKDKNLLKNCAKALMILANGRAAEVEEKAEELANNLRQKAA